MSTLIQLSVGAFTFEEFKDQVTLHHVGPAVSIIPIDF
jgi:hypothetical protein